MAGEIQIDYGITGATLYAILTSGTNTFYNANTPGFEAYNAANWTSTKYCRALTEDGSSGHYKGTFPVIAAGVYNISIRLQAGGSPAVTDTNVGAGQMQWDGTAEQSLYGLIAALGNTVNTGATFNVANSVFKQIRQAAGAPIAIRTGTAQTGSTASTIKLDSGASSTNNIYQGAKVVITGGTGVGQQRNIIAYSGSTKVATVDKNWVTTPDNTSTFELDLGTLAITSDEGTAQAGGATTITLAASAKATDSYYVPSLVAILSGTGSGQTREITAYVGATRVATVDSAWSVNPDSTSVYAVIPSGGTVSDNAPAAPTASEIVATLLARLVTQRDLSAVTAPTVEDGLLAALAQAAGDRSVVGTALVCKNLDGSTFRVFVLDSATSPTSRT